LARQQQAPIAVETLRVIGAAMAEGGVVGLGRLTLSRRERMVVAAPRGTGMALFTLRAAEEVRATQFGMAEGELDAEMVASPKRSSRGGPEVSIRRRIGIVTRRPCEN
jgi:non-homologous end joining protein Ku